MLFLTRETVQRINNILYTPVLTNVKTLYECLYVFFYTHRHSSLPTHSYTFYKNESTLFMLFIMCFCHLIHHTHFNRCRANFFIVFFLNRQFIIKINYIKNTVKIAPPTLYFITQFPQVYYTLQVTTIGKFFCISIKFLCITSVIFLLFI